MKKLFALLLLVTALRVSAQNYPVTGINITLPQNPDANTAKWGSGASMLQLSAQTSFISGRVDDRVRDSRVLVNIRKGGSKICGVYTANSAPASNFSTASKIWSGNNALSLLGQECNLPPGDYEICVQFFGNGAAGSVALSEEKCRSFSIRGNEQESSRAPMLISPEDGYRINETDALKPVTFRWLQSPKPAGPVTYRLRVWQLMEGQSALQTSRSSEPFITKDVKDAFQAIIQLRQPLPNRNLVWNVQALNRDGKPVGENNGISATFTIIINPVNDPPSIITLISPANLSSVAAGEAPRFNWQHKNHPTGSVYRIKIVEILSDQSPEEAYRGNKPHFEKDSLKEWTILYPETAKRLESGKRYAWRVSLGRPGETKIMESEIREFNVQALPPPCPVITVTSNFNCSGFSIGSSVHNTSATLSVVSWTLSSPNTVLVSGGVQFATGTYVPMVAMPGSSAVINTNQTVNSNAVGVLQPNSGSTMILIYTFHLSNGQTCEIENMVTWYPNCAASLCACGSWGNFEYGYYANGLITGTPQPLQVTLTGNAASITVDQGSRIVPLSGYNCSGNCANTNYVFDLYKTGVAAPIISHTWGANLSDDGHVLEHQFTCGDYVLTVYPSCTGALNLSCATATINIHVTCTNPCNCGGWNPVSVKLGTAAPVTVPCDNSSNPVAMLVTDPLSIDATINCNPGGTACAGTQTADIYYPDGTLAASNLSLPLVNWTLPLQNICGTVKVVLKGKCNSLNCASCILYFSVTCPPPPPVCSCNWSQLAWTNNGVTQTKINSCGETVHTSSGNIVFFPAYTCSPSSCTQAAITYTITNNGVAVGAANRPSTTPTGVLAAGTYLVSFAGSCNGTICQCAVTIIVDPACQCAGWNAIPVASNGVQQAAVNPGGVLSGNPGSNFLFSPTYSCNPAASCAQAAVTYTITQGGVAVGSPNRPLTTLTGNLPVGLYLVTFYGNCGGTICTTTIRLNITGTVCSCNGWRKLLYRPSHGHDDYIAVNCEKEETITIHSEDLVDFVLKPDCSGCEPTSRLNIYYPHNTGTVPDTVISQQEVSFMFRDCGEYRVEFKGSCGNSTCKACRMIIKVDCPPTTCGCSGITGISFRKGNNAPDSLVSCTGSPAILNAVQGDVFSRLTAMFTCTGPASCLSTSFVDIYLPNSSAFTTHVLGGDHPFGYRFETCGQYKLVFRGKCGTVACSSCTVLVNVASSCCEYIKLNSFQVNTNNGTFSASFTTSSTIVFSKVKVQILELTSGGNAKAGANIKVLNKASTPVWPAGSRDVAISGTSVTNQATAFWFPPPGPYNDTPAGLAFSGQLVNFAPLTAPVVFRVRFTFYRNDAGCGNTICEKDLTFTN